MEDEQADIELLEQHLHKTSLISKRMTTTLSKFDGRLEKLEKSILPLHKSTQALTRLAENIESTLQSIDKVASNQEGIAAEEALILRGPRPSDLTTYVDAIERLNANIAFKGSDRQTTGETARLVETGAKKLCQMFTKLIAEASSNNAAMSPISPSGLSMQYQAISPNMLPQLRPLVIALRGLPLPSTHPSHPSAKGIEITLKEAQAGYAEMRGSWGKKWVESGSRKFMGIIETSKDGGGVETGKEVGTWVKNLLEVAQIEYDTLKELALLPSSSNIQLTFSSLVSSMRALVISTLSNIQTTIKKKLRTHIFLAFGIYTKLSSLQPTWDDVMRSKTGRKENELSEALHAFRGTCLRSFPELIMDLKQAAAPPPGSKQVEVGTGVAEITTTTVNYFNQIPEVQDGVCAALHTLGDGNWKMGDGGLTNRTAATAGGEEDDRLLLEHYAFDVVQTLTSTLSALSKTHKRPSLGSIFILNNISYLRSKLILEPESPAEFDFISSNSQIQTHLNAQYRTAKAIYYETNFASLLAALGDERHKGKAGTKEKFAIFFDALEEIAERHRFARVLADDPDGREALADDVVKLVIPALQRFIQKNKDKEFSKNPQKYIKATPDEVEQQIRKFYS